MEERHYALYVEGKDKPMGTLRDSTLSALDEIKEATGKKYRTEIITSEQAEQITRDILPKCSEVVEMILSKRDKC